MASWSAPDLAARIGGGDSDSVLRAHAKFVPANELNSTFYGWSRERFVRWRKLVPDAFRFCVKLPGRITHELALDGADGEMAAFVDASEALGETRGLVWFALPPFMPVDRQGALLRFLDRWCERVPLAVELRHASWFAPRGLDALADRMAARGVTWIQTDTAGRRDVLHGHLTTARTMVRFLANGLHTSDFERLDAWADRLLAWSRCGLREAYLFFHQNHDALTVDLAEYMEQQLVERGIGVLGEWHRATGYQPPERQLEMF